MCARISINVLVRTGRASVRPLSAKHRSPTDWLDACIFGSPSYYSISFVVIDRRYHLLYARTHTCDTHLFQRVTQYCASVCVRVCVCVRTLDGSRAICYRRINRVMLWQPDRTSNTHTHTQRRTISGCAGCRFYSDRWQIASAFCGCETARRAKIKRMAFIVGRRARYWGNCCFWWTAVDVIGRETTHSDSETVRSGRVCREGIACDVVDFDDTLVNAFRR